MNKSQGWDGQIFFLVVLVVLVYFDDAYAPQIGSAGFGGRRVLRSRGCSRCVLFERARLAWYVFVDYSLLHVVNVKADAGRTACPQS